MSGMLYLVPTPIGNLGDLSDRIRETLAEADFIARRRHPSLFEAAEPFGAEKTAGQLF